MGCNDAPNGVDEMTDHTISLAGDFTVNKGPRDKSWVATVTVDRSALSAEIVAQLIDHGLKQLIADAASQATTLDEATAMMGKKVDALLAGDWSARRGDGSGASEETLVARSIIRGKLKLSMGSKSPAWAAFTGLEPSAQLAKLDALVTKNADKLAPAIAAELKRRADERKAKAALDIDFDI